MHGRPAAWATRFAHKRIWIVGLAIGSLVGLLGIVGIAGPSTAAEPTPYVMIGDSITWQATAELEDAIPNGRIDGVIGRSFSAGFAPTSAALADGIPSVLIVALGTNPTMTEALVDEYMDLVADVPHVIFVTISIPRPWEEPTNELIESLPAKYQGVSVIDWNGFASSRPWVFNDSEFHLSDEGIPVYAEFIAEQAYQAAGRCAEDEHLHDGTCNPNGRFVDDDWSTFEADIEWMAEAGITTGCNPPSNTRFCPTNRLTRGQMAAVLVRALELPAPLLWDRFVDDDGSTFEGDIDRLADAGITRGCNPPANDRFCPDAPVTRGEFAAFAVRALGLDDGAVPELFSDDNGHVFEREINILGRAGITKGCNPPTNDRFCPDRVLTRGEVAALVRRALSDQG